jgi:hypothetical protein
MPRPSETSEIASDRPLRSEAASSGKLSTSEVSHMSDTLLSHHKLTTETDLLREMQELRSEFARLLKGRMP